MKIEKKTKKNLSQNIAQRYDYYLSADKEKCTEKTELNNQKKSESTAEVLFWFVVFVYDTIEYTQE